MTNQLFTKQNVLAWAKEQVLDEPVLQINGQDVANTPKIVLQSALTDHYMQEWSDSDREACKSLETMNVEQLVDKIMEVCKSYKFQTMEKFARYFKNWDTED